VQQQKRERNAESRAAALFSLPWVVSLLTAFGCVLVAGGTYLSLQPVEKLFFSAGSEIERYRVTDRNGEPLSLSYQGSWNQHDLIPLHDVPETLQSAFVRSEDHRFFEHHGVDWLARGSSVWQSLRHFRRFRGASTITEQVVRMLNPRPRTVWSKWIEGFEAARLERHVSKAEILEFYLNQVPYAAERRGVSQAAHYYFNRDLSTLSLKETLALVVLARAPSGYDLYTRGRDLTGSIVRLGRCLHLTEPEIKELDSGTLALERPEALVNASHFIQYVRRVTPVQMQADLRLLRTTLDATLQRRAQSLLDTRIKGLAARRVNNGALLVADHISGEILAWVVGGANDKCTPGRMIDAVTVPRQPGSALKPFLYARALDAGWTPATVIKDEPFNAAVGNGLHRFNNYSHLHYGSVTLRQALGNSLNIPAIHTIAFVGVPQYLDLLRAIGFESLTRDASVYDEGLALGDGEVTLLELVSGYAALAHRGVYSQLTVSKEIEHTTKRRVISEEAASLVGDILSDPWARSLEFGVGSVLNLPVQTAVKTGTSTDYRDAWAVGYNDRYVVGTWMGNLDHSPMDGVTGSTGPALTLRSVFKELNAHRTTHPLFMSPRLKRIDLCIPQPGATECVKRSEYFMPESPQAPTPLAATSPRIALLQPTKGLHLAIDPRVPPEKQAFEFVVSGVEARPQVEWILDGNWLARSAGGRYLWQLTRGAHTLRAVVWSGQVRLGESEVVDFLVR
jgi:penicillin-binding protein 1C